MTGVAPAGQVPSGLGDLTGVQGGSSVSAGLVLFLVGSLAVVTALTVATSRRRAARRNPRRRSRR